MWKKKNIQNIVCKITAQSFGVFSTQTANSLELAEPWISYNGSQDGRQVAESHEGVVDGGGKVFIPPQEVA